MTEDRPAFYALAPGGWRDWWTLLHPPYTAWHLSYVVIGGCLAPGIAWGRLAAAVAAFALAVGVVLFSVLRQVGMGGWLSAVVIGTAIALLVALDGAATAADALIRLGVAVTVAMIWWKIMDLWTSRPRPGGRSPHIN